MFLCSSMGGVCRVGVSSAGFGNISQTPVSLRVTESSSLEKTSKIKSNHQPIITMPIKPEALWFPESK